MGDYYRQYLSSMAMVGGHQLASPQGLHPPSVLGMPFQLGPMIVQNPYASLGSAECCPSFPETANYPPKPTRGRRRGAGAGADHVKHRRTRSGCFMCRSRRVKCDEARPICGRCTKGKRECVYPDPATGKGASTGLSKGSHPGTPEDPLDDAAADGERNGALEPIPDEGEENPYPEQQRTPTWAAPQRSSPVSLHAGAARETRGGSETPSQDDNRSSPMSTTSGSQAYTGQPGSPSRDEWAHLPPEIRQHLDYFCENITHYHYCMSSDVDDFFRITLPSLAVRHEALLHAVVGFSAYQSTMQDPDGQMSDFLQHFNRSVQLLIELFRKKEKPNVGTLLTILQLGLIEEYLGDWINLLGHQKAAFEILTDLFTPQTIMQTPLGRVILLWYIRYDVFIALMGGFPAALPHEWFTTMVEFHRNKCIAEPKDLRWKYAFISADLRLLSMEISVLIARENRDEITREEFAAEHDRITQRLTEWKTGLDPAITDPAYLVTDLARGRQPDPDDIVDPYAPGVLFDFPLFMTTEMTAEWNSVMVMHKCQSSTIDRNELYAELAAHSYAICQVFEAVEKWPYSPRGALILIQACLSIASLFLPRDAKHHKWVKRKFALLECHGYIQTLSIRSKMADLFRDPDCVRWWLPNDEGFSKVLQSIREFADERNAVAQTAQAESIREVQHLFSKLELKD